MRLPLLALSLSLLSSSTAADVIVVPTDVLHLEAAIELASPGDEIIVQTPASQNWNGSPTVDKPLTIIGDPVCNIDIGALGLRLDGDGAGELTLVNVNIQYKWADADGRPALVGGGFDSVRLVGCSIRHNNLSPSGFVTMSYPAVELADVDLLTVVESELLGGPGGADDCVSFGAAESFVDGREGVLGAAVAPDLGGAAERGAARGGADVSAELL